MKMKINYKDLSVVTKCPFCGYMNEIKVNEADYYDWKDGVLAQDAFPYLSDDEREALISGICVPCWNEMFGFGDAEVEDEEPSDDDLEFGFNPYEGCYDFDC